VRRVRLRRTMERGLCEHDQPYICAVSDDEGLLRRLFRGALGNEGVCSVGFWEGKLVLFLGPNLCMYVLYYVLYYNISSLCSGGFADATVSMCWFSVWWGHGTDVPWTGCV
jgi:hypothetical protein